MREHMEMYERASAYVLGALEPDEAAAFARHAASCSDCAELVAELRAIRDALPLTVPQVDPPPALKSRIMTAVRAEARSAPSTAEAPTRPGPLPMRPARRGLSMRILAAAAAVVLIALVATTGWALSLQSELDASRQRTASLYHAMTVLAGADQRWDFSGSSISPDARGLLAYSSQEQAAMLIVWGLPEQEEDQVYNAWTLDDGQRQGVGSMRRANGGLWIVIEGDITTVDGVGITLRDENAPAGQEARDVLVLSLANPS